MVTSLQWNQTIWSQTKRKGADMEPLAYTVNDACRLLCIGRTTFYRRAKDGTIKTRKLGTRTLVLVKDLQQLVDSLPAGPGASE